MTDTDSTNQDFDPNEKAPDHVPMDDAKVALLRQNSQLSLVDFIRHVSPWFVMDAVHLAICLHLERLVIGEIDRLMIHTSPRTGKSKIVSVFGPAWMAGNFPAIKLLNCSHTLALQEGFAQETIDLMQGERYQDVFPDLYLTREATKHFRFRNHNSEIAEDGEARIAGVGKKIAGFGFNVSIVDDPTSEQDYLSADIQEKNYTWYSSGLYTRRQLEWNRICIMATRWRYDDLPGRVLDHQEETGEQWEILSVPAILDRTIYPVLWNIATSDREYVRQVNSGEMPLLKVNDTFMPSRMPLEEIKKARVVVPNFEAQYMQRPSKEEGAIYKRKMFKFWPKDEKGNMKEAPVLETIISAYDTAFSDKQTADFTARITAGIFTAKMVDPKERTEFMAKKVLIIEADQKRIEAADLFEECVANHKHWSAGGTPHLTVVEDKASGIQLAQELKRARIPTIAWWPQELRAGARDKVSRANMAVIHVKFGDIYLYDIDNSWSDLFMQEITGFPLREHDDIPDAFSMLILFFRRHFLLNVPFDEPDEEEKKDMIATPRAHLNDAPRRSYGVVPI